MHLRLNIPFKALQLQENQRKIRMINETMNKTKNNNYQQDVVWWNQNVQWFEEEFKSFFVIIFQTKLLSYRLDNCISEMLELSISFDNILCILS